MNNLITNPTSFQCQKDFVIFLNINLNTEDEAFKTEIVFSISYSLNANDNIKQKSMPVTRKY